MKLQLILVLLRLTYVLSTPTDRSSTELNGSSGDRYPDDALDRLGRYMESEWWSERWSELWSEWWPEWGLELDPELVTKYMDEIISDSSDDDRPQEIQELEKTLEDGLNTFLEIELQEFKTISSDLIQTIDAEINSQNKSSLVQKLKSLFSSSSTESDFEKKQRFVSILEFSQKLLETHLKNFKVYFKSIKELNNVLMDKLKDVFNKISTVSFDKSIEPEKEIGMLSIGDENHMEHIKKTLMDIIPVISQAMKCRFIVVYTINWIGERLEYTKNKVEWMTLREELVKLKQIYHAIEINLNEYLTSFNKMISNPDERDDSKVKKVMDYLEETIKEGKFNSKTEEIIKKIQKLKIPSLLKILTGPRNNNVYQSSTSSNIFIQNSNNLE